MSFMAETVSMIYSRYMCVPLLQKEDGGSLTKRINDSSCCAIHSASIRTSHGALRHLSRVYNLGRNDPGNKPVDYLLV